MTAPRIDVTDPTLRRALRAVARQAGANPDEGISVGWIFSQRAVARGRGPGWVVAATRRALRWGAIPAGTIRIDDDDPDGRSLAETLAAAEPERPTEYTTDHLPPIWRARLAELDGVATAADLGRRWGVTPRRGQQILAGWLADAGRIGRPGEQMGLFFGGDAPEGGV
ncbi:MAG: hypothetical protein Q8Q28_18375 [Pseudomonadota bacterium]|nr:hypothetical protein [Pseudomonadota bacterium]